MRTSRRLAVVSAVLGGGLLLAGPAAAQSATDCDEYERLGFCPIGGSVEQPANDVDDDGSAGESTTASGAASLPFTGGEVTMIALAGAAALGGGVVLTAAGRKRSNA